MPDDMTPMQAAIWKEAQRLGRSRRYPAGQRDDLVQEAATAGLERLGRGGATLDFIKKSMKSAIKRYRKIELRYSRTHKSYPEDGSL